MWNNAESAPISLGVFVSKFQLSEPSDGRGVIRLGTSYQVHSLQAATRQLLTVRSVQLFTSHVIILYRPFLPTINRVILSDEPPIEVLRLAPTPAAAANHDGFLLRLAVSAPKDKCDVFQP
jgi:hypothetical protein